MPDVFMKGRAGCTEGVCWNVHQHAQCSASAVELLPGVKPNKVLSLGCSAADSRVTGIVCANLTRM